MNKPLLVSALAAVAALFALPAAAQVCGTTVYDTGGPGGNYANNQNYSVTYCPTIAGQAVTINFSSFATEANYDFLSIHNGTTNGATQMGIFSGTANPGSFTSTHPSGCLTIWFTSDGSVVGAGWVANITCAPLPPPPPICGSIVYDTGGPGGNYANNQNYTVTYCPSVPGQAVTMNFNSFSVEPAGFFGVFDYLSIFNGPTTGSAQMGTWTGTNSPGSITSTHPSGCLTIQFVSDGSVTFPGWAATITCSTPPPPPAGDCVYVLTLQDSFGDGWGSSSVGISINGGPYQYYTVGAYTNQVLIGVNIGDVVVLTYNNSGPWQGENSYSLALSSGGTLFASGTPPSAGISYSGLVDCAPPPAPIEDCIGGLTLCSNQSIVNNTNNTGNVADLNPTSAGCLANNERQGTWYNFSPSTSGTLAFTINPANPLDDYDFALWGPFPEGSTTANICPPLGAPLRCSYAAPSGDTGLNFTATDLTEPATGDKWVRYLDVVQGQVYLLYISNWSQSGLAFNLNFNPASTATLDCTVLPVQWLGLEARPASDHVEVLWATATEQNTQLFVVERAGEDGHFSPIGSVPAAGNSQEAIAYSFSDAHPLEGINYYRLQQVDTDGASMHSNTVQAIFRFGAVTALVIPNPATDQISLLLSKEPPANFTLLLMDAAGRTVVAQAFANGTAGQRLAMHIAHLDAGVYTVALRDEHGAQLVHARFVKE